MKRFATFISFLVCACSSEEAETSSTNNTDAGSNGADCAEVLAGTWNFTYGERTSLVEPPEGSFCRTIGGGGTIAATVSEDLKRLTIVGNVNTFVYDIAPIDSTCSRLVATLTSAYSDDATVRGTHTLQRESDGTLTGEAETILYDNAAGPEAFDCKVNIAVTAAR
jgi:hypothetical protein